MSRERPDSHLTPLPLNENPAPRFGQQFSEPPKLRVVSLEKKPFFSTLDLREKKLAVRRVLNGEKPEDVLEPGYWKGRRRLKVTAMHELGHETVSKGRGHHPSIISIIRRGDTLGYVRSVFDTSKGDEQVLKDQIALAHGGMLMERRIGHTDHSGAGHDMGQARRAATFLAIYFGGGTPEQHMEAGKEVAKSDIDAIDMNTFEDRAEHLMEVEEIAA